MKLDGLMDEILCPTLGIYRFNHDLEVCKGWAQKHGAISEVAIAQVRTFV